ncbi:MAG: hypothetical protein VX666_00795, partial [Candidatus Thermoplasmatota archaeon]|nr:hypothetical protein [Candidatus Thermoplasmatota archaeon]
MTRFDQLDYYGYITYAGRTVAFSISDTGEIVGIHPKIGITGLPRSGKSAVLQKVMSMLIEERKQEKRARNDDPNAKP